MDSWEFFEFSKAITEDELYDLAWECARHNAETYGIYPASEYDEEDIEQDPESYSDNIEGTWYLYDPEKHDGHSIGGKPCFEQYQY